MDEAEQHSPCSTDCMDEEDRILLRPISPEVISLSSSDAMSVIEVSSDDGSMHDEDMHSGGVFVEDSAQNLEDI